MDFIRLSRRVAGVSALMLLAACQTPPKEQEAPEAVASTVPAAEAPSTSTATVPDTAPQSAASLAVFLADTSPQEGWAEVKLANGTLYVNPEPVITRNDLVRIQAGRDQGGEGLLALDLSELAKQRISSVTEEYPGRRLALVIDNTMLAAPSYDRPVTTGRLIFAVGTEENAAAAARAVAGGASASDPAP